MASRVESSAPNDPAPRARWMWLALWPALLVCATVAAFWPCVNQGFVALDDDANFELNYLFRGLGPEQLEWMFKGYHYGHWHPLTWLTFGFDFVRHGLDGAAYHRTNLAIHALSVAAFYFLALELLRWIVGWSSATRPAVALDTSRSFALHACAALATATWGLHPLRVESVAWATERRDLLSALFLALTVLCYLRGCRFGSARLAWLPLALAAFSCSLLSKAWGMTLPVVLLALDVFPLRRVATRAREGLSWRTLILEKAWFVPFAAFTAYHAAAAQRQISAAVSLDEHGVMARAAQAAYGLCFYVVKTVLPTDLSCHYLLELDFSPTKPIYVAAIATVVLVSLVLLLFARRFPALLATWFVYGVLVSPVLGILQSGAQKVADRYAHLSAMPFSILVAGAALAWLARREEARARWRGAFVVSALACSAALGLGMASNAQTRVWRDSETLFRRASEVEPHNYFVLHNLCVALYRRGAYDEALEVELRSVAAHPGKGNEEARYTVGLLHKLAGRLSEAESAWREALEVAPDHLNSLNSLKSLVIGRGDVEGLIRTLETLVERHPSAAALHDELDRLYAQRQEFAKVVELWERARGRAVLPTAKVELGLARGYAAQRRLAEAEPLAFRAASSDKSAKLVLDGLAQAQQSPAAAVEFWERARRARVPAAMVENGIGKALLAAGRLGEAEPYLVRAQALDAFDKDYVLDVCELFLRQNRRDDALRNAEAVLAVDPSHARAQAFVRQLRAGARKP
ncbi:MAG: hypothetical protein IT454_15075 [Planctomycetes bacterium]|nr:hypothetical protein [Planctomycetota bacterium]